MRVINTVRGGENEYGGDVVEKHADHADRETEVDQQQLGVTLGPFRDANSEVFKAAGRAQHHHHHHHPGQQQQGVAVKCVNRLLLAVETDPGADADHHHRTDNRRPGAVHPLAEDQSVGSKQNGTGNPHLLGSGDERFFHSELS